MKDADPRQDEVATLEDDGRELRPTSSLHPWSFEHAGLVARTGSIGIENAAELERTSTLLAMTADIVRKLARVQAERERDELADIAETIDGVVDRITGLLLPLERRQ